MSKKDKDDDSEVVWFDGVDKKLIEAHATKMTLVEGDDHSLMTKTPLASFSSYAKQNNKKILDEARNSKKRKNSADDSNRARTSSESNVEIKKKKPKIVADGNSKSFKDHVRPNTGITDELAIDCEMVECFHHKSVLARVSIVNLFGHPLMDKYVAPPAPVTDYRTKWSGIRRLDLVDAPDFDTVRQEVANLIKDRIVVGHAVHHDFQVLKIHHPPDKIRDTSHYFKYLFQGKTPSLKKLTESVLGVKIQKGEHDSVQDAQATMKLYVKERDRWNQKLLKEKQAHAGKHKQKTIPKKKKVKTFYVMT